MSKGGFLMTKIFESADVHRATLPEECGGLNEMDCLIRTRAQWD